MFEDDRLNCTIVNYFLGESEQPALLVIAKRLYYQGFTRMAQSFVYIPYLIQNS